ncbi:unnamed protein product, partial [Prorocentrum cordatum]
PAGGRTAQTGRASTGVPAAATRLARRPLPPRAAPRTTRGCCSTSCSCAWAGQSA